MPSQSGSEGRLVVEGNMNTDGPTTIKLTRSVEMTSQYNAVPETGAAVQIESEDQQVFTLAEQGSGLYSRSRTSYPPAQRYRLKIKTKDGLEFYSQYVILKQTPPIQRVYWERTEDGVDILVDTGDPTDQTRYYKWDWEETWKFETDITASITLLGQSNVQPISNLPRYPYHGDCWQSEKSSDILIESTSKLAHDLVAKKRLTAIPNNSWKLGVKYSINVRQRAITQESYQYWEKIKKNSSDLGGISSPMPSEVDGNFYCATDPSVPVIGFFDASNIVEQRMFVSRPELITWGYDNSCPVYTTLNATDSIKFFIYQGGNYLIDYVDVSERRVSYARPYCLDCSVRGTPIRPSFWPN